MASYTWGRDAQRQTGMNDNDLIQECLRSLAIIHKKSNDEIKRLFMNGIVKKWDLDENALGAFTLFGPHQVRKTYACYLDRLVKIISLFLQYSQIDDDLRAIEGKLFFAGEHTMSPHAWIDTAMKSGVRAAKEVSDAAGC